MSTLKVTNIESPSGGGVSAKITDIGGGQLSNRNKIINGAMTIDQRNAGAAVTHSGSSNLYVLDRWVCNSTGTPQFSVQRVADGPVGFTYSSKLTTTTSGTPAAGDFSYYIQYIEGYNVADLEFGTANAKTVTVSFYVKSSLTGTFGGALRNGAANRAYPFLYTISSANTWEYKTVTIAGDTTGTWAIDNTRGVIIAFDTGSGSNNKGTAGAWAASAAIGVTGGVNLVETASATWQITGVQLEVGDTATSFEHRSYAEELERCLRYCENINTSGGIYMITTNVLSSNMRSQHVPYKVVKRTTPSISFTNTVSEYILPSSGGVYYSSFSFVTYNDSWWRLEDNVSRSTGTIYAISGTLIADAEL